MNEAVFATIDYADIQDRPLTLDELHRDLIGGSLTLVETSMAVDELLQMGRVQTHDDLIFLPERTEIVDRHVERSARAVDVWHEAEAWLGRIARLPFVRMVAVRGGLPHGAVDSGQPIDTLVVVRPRRLWMTRRMIGMLGMFAGKAGVHLAPPSLLTTRAMAFDARSMHLAHELATMSLITGLEVGRTLRRSNKWLFDLLPNATVDGDTRHLDPYAPTRSQRWVERFLLLPIFRIVENHERRRGQSMPGSTRDHPSCSADVCVGPLLEVSRTTDEAWKKRVWQTAAEQQHCGESDLPLETPTPSAMGRPH